MSLDPRDITAILDACCDAFSFPILDNGYVYLAAARLSTYRSEANWALVIETFGYSPREGFPAVAIQTFASCLRDRDPPARYVTHDAYDAYLARNPHNEFRSAHPFDEIDWLDSDDAELVAEGIAEVRLRGNSVTIPSPSTYGALGIELARPPRIHVFELCRALAELRRDQILATPHERRASVSPDLQEFLVLDDWHHPDVVRDTERPSNSEAFAQLALALATGDPRHYRPTLPPNTHWGFWPDGGTL
jgi:hypothetical protein